jgi:hypothetical protein
VWGKKRESGNRTPLQVRWKSESCYSSDRQCPHRGGGSCTGWFSTWIAADGDRTADDAGHAAGHSDADLTGHAFRCRDQAGFTNLTTDRVGNLSSADLLLHLADGVGNLTSAGFLNHAAGGVGNSAGNAFLSPRAGRIGYLASAGFLNHVADGVWNLLRAGLSREAAGGVWDFRHTLDWHLAADRVGHLLVADFGDHASAGHCFLDNFRHPATAANCGWRALNANLFAAAGIAGIADAFFHNCTRDLASLRYPFSAALVNRTTFGDRLECGVANVFPAGLRFSFPAGSANIAITGLVHRFADSVANCSVTGLVNGLANGVAHIAVSTFGTQACEYGR